MSFDPFGPLFPPLIPDLLPKSIFDSFTPFHDKLVAAASVDVLNLVKPPHWAKTKKKLVTDGVLIDEDLQKSIQTLGVYRAVVAPCIKSDQIDMLTVEVD